MIRPSSRDPFAVAVDDPRAHDVRALLERHLAFASSHSPAEDVHALDVEALIGPDITFVSCRAGERLLGVAALKQLDGRHAELKSMHTAEEARGRGVGRALVDHLIGVARSRGLARVSLETGTVASFAPAHALYAGAGFTPCGPFGGYRPGPNSTFLTLGLDDR
jgi:putative acetyltransferase